ncbi:MAG: EamA family transporter [Clostridia bacterium]|nr:EamA family transporter [Clostridia bacterium]
MAKSKSSAALGGLFVVLAGCLWGTTGLFIKELNMAGLTSMQICELRAAITALVMLLLTVCIKPSLLRIRLRDIWIFLGSGVGSILFFNYCYFNAIQASGMAVAATLLYTSPVFVMLLSLPLFGEKITGRKVVSLIMTVAGCVLVSGVFAAGSSFTKEGVLYGIGAGFGYALYSIFTRYAIRHGYESMTITTYTFLVATVGGVLLTDFGEIVTATVAGGANLWLLLVGYAVVTTIAPYLLYTNGLRHIENSKAAVMAAVEPACATLLQIVVLRTFPGPVAMVGILLVLTAIVVLNTGRKRR